MEDLLFNADISTQQDLERAVNLLRESGALSNDFKACNLPILLEDALPLSDQTLGEARSLLLEVTTKGKRIVLSGVFQRADSRNANGRIYPLDLLTREVDRLQPAIKARQLLGELDHPQSAKIRIPFASHVMTKLWIVGNEVYGELEPLSTSYGHELRALIGDRIKLGVSSRGTGNLSNDDRGLIVQPNYRLVTFDIVSDPSTQGAYPAPANEEMSVGVCTNCGDCSTDCKDPQSSTTIPEDTTRNLLAGSQEAQVERLLRLAKRL